MIAPWWGREATPSPRRVHLVPADRPARTQPELLPSPRTVAIAEIRSRFGGYTPEWRSHRPDDAGEALLRVFGELREATVMRLDRLPQKLLVEYLRAAGVQPLPPTAAEAMLEFAASPTADASKLVARGFQVSAQPASGQGDPVVFETDRDLFVAPATIAQLFGQEPGLFRNLGAPSPDAPIDPTVSFLPFGRNAQAGCALLIGLAGSSTPTVRLSLGIGVFAPPGAPPPIAAGGVVPLPTPAPPLLRWEILDGGSFVALEIELDETNGLSRSGIVELRLPSTWRPGVPPGLDGTDPLRWLRLRIALGGFDPAPALVFVRVNTVPATAATTLRDEVLEQIDARDPSRLQLAHAPLLAGTLQIAVDEGGDLDPQSGTAAQPPLQPWREVVSLDARRPDERVFVLDATSGEVTFGDGVHGAAVPPGFRNVSATSYRTGGGSSGAVAAGAITTLVSSAPSIVSVNNPQPASGGTDSEVSADTLRRGPQEIRARGRAVTLADYELLAPRAPGAEVRRAHAMAGTHPSFPGTVVPGLVGVLVVPRETDAGPPTPDQATLRAVARYLTTVVAPAGVEVVVGAPRYHRVRVEASVQVDPALDVGATVRAVLDALDRYLDPLEGGDDGSGWPFGGPIRYAPLLRQLVEVPGVRAVPTLSLVVDNLRIALCADHPIPPHDLVWPADHEVVPLSAGDAP